jgi:hypothetical protein
MGSGGKKKSIQGRVCTSTDAPGSVAWIVTAKGIGKLAKEASAVVRGWLRAGPLNAWVDP